MGKGYPCSFKEQARPMEKESVTLVYLYMDEKTNRLVASSKTNQFQKTRNLLLKREKK
jgi:hypothetical protein